jgi:hypothetical protein
MQVQGLKSAEAHPRYDHSRSKATSLKQTELKPGIVSRFENTV